jgi:8-oxo-dGTP pyrophosphatase MutT (NUDIX family)
MTAATSFSKIPNFDPRKSPVVSTDAHLPQVAQAQLTPQALRQRFAAPPAWHKFTERAPAQAAVLLGLVMRDELAVLLTQRTAHLSTHSGQIAFAGGKADPEDKDSSDTALREAYEEVGVLQTETEVIGHLPTYTTGTAFIITPVVALITPDYTCKPNPHEVADVFEVPLSFLMNPAHHRRHVVEWDNIRREWLSMPYTDALGHERFIWGATAGMLRNFYRFLSA